MADRDTHRIVHAPGTAITATGSAIIPLSSNVDATTLDVIVDISAVSGTTPTLTVSVARAADVVRGTHPPASFGTATSTAALTAVGRTVLSVPAAIDALTGASSPFARVTWTIGGTSPSFTLGMYVE